MVYGRSRFRGSRSSSYVSGGFTPKQPAASKPPWEARIDKNPIYRTHDILNGIFKKKGEKRVRLEQGNINATDGETIWCRFSDKVERKLISIEDDGGPLYTFDCGHTYRDIGKKQHVVGEELQCWKCSEYEGYLGFEHEWCHHWGKSDIVATELFVNAMLQDYGKLAPNLDAPLLRLFLHLVTNAFEDLRVNSLNEKVYPGSAEGLWKRWKRLTLKRGDAINENFLDFLFAAALGVPTSSESEFAPLRPIVEWGADRIRYKGPANGFAIIRVTVDRCIGSLLKDFEKKQQQQQSGSGANGTSQPGTSQTQQSQGGEQEEDDGEQEAQGEDGSDDRGDGDQGDAGVGEEDRADDGGGSQTPQGATGSPSLPKGPSARQMMQQQSAAGGSSVNQILQQLTTSTEPLDDAEEHKRATPENISKHPNPASIADSINKAMRLDPSDDEGVEQMVAAGHVDEDVAQAIGQLKSGLAQQSEQSHLTSDARAKVQLFDVKPGDVCGTRTELSSQEFLAADRMHTTFIRALGKMEAKRSTDGSTIDMDALIQRTIELGDDDGTPSPTSTEDIFESDALSQGFAYQILVDMSGSMQGSPFQQVCRGVEMLKKALKFPFVRGDLWGFRGATPLDDRRDNDYGEVWLYRYDKNCQAYTGSTMARIGSQRYKVPVECAGVTPMNSALRIAVRQMITRVPAGMAKRIFLLTDGSPAAMKVGTQGQGFGFGKQIPDFLLRQFVRREVNHARSKGVHVYALLIGSGVSEEQAKAMFDPKKYWAYTESDPNSQQSIDRVLTKMVVDNFTRYLRARA